MAMETMIETFGGRVRARRLELGMTQNEVARRMEIQVVQISNWERDTCLPKLSMVLRLSRALEIPPGELVDGIPGSWTGEN